jgi:hypothetical protein
MHQVFIEGGVIRKFWNETNATSSAPRIAASGFYCRST